MKKIIRISLMFLLGLIVFFHACSKKTPTGPDSYSIHGITFVSIPGNSFQMGNGELFAFLNETPIHTVTVSSFQMSEAEITNSQYCEYLNAALAIGDITATSTSVTGAKGPYSGQEYISLTYFQDLYNIDNWCWITFSNNVFSVVQGHENWPVVYITWYGSKAFAEFYGWDLPREAEWEYACRGGKQHKYGTDDGTISRDKANYYWGKGCIDRPVDVKSYPKNPFGLFDMSGNVCEWCVDWFGSYSSEPSTNPTGAETGSARVVRGGVFHGTDNYCRSSGRDEIEPPQARYSGGGFRVVRR
jgi:formylglycine-generating enzyme required for sulfatase activity